MKIKKSILFFCFVGVFFHQLVDAISPEKFGDYVNLSITIIPYAKALVTYLQRQRAKATGISKKEIEKKYPYRLIGFGSYGVAMASYLAIMFVTQKYLWHYGKKTFIPDTTYLVPAYTLLGTLVGLISMGSGLIGSKILTHLLRLK